MNAEMQLALGAFIWGTALGSIITWGLVFLQDWIEHRT
jgi:hypothetical protein